MKNPTLEINSPLLRRRDVNRISCSAGCSQFSGCHRYKSIPWPDKPTCILSFFPSFPAELPTLKSHTEFRSAAETDMTSLQKRICPWKISLSVRTSTSRFSLFSPSSLFSYFWGSFLCSSYFMDPSVLIFQFWLLLTKASIMTESSCYCWSCDRNPVHLLTYSIDLYPLQGADEDHRR